MVKRINKFQGNAKYVPVCTGTKFIPCAASRVCCISDLSVCIVYSLSAPLLNPVVTRSDSVLSDDRPAAIGFCSALCLPGVALVGNPLHVLVWLKLKIEIIIFKFCQSKIKTIVPSCPSKAIFHSIVVFFYCIYEIFFLSFLFGYFCNHFDIKLNEMTFVI